MRDGIVLSICSVRFSRSANCLPLPADLSITLRLVLRFFCGVKNRKGSNLRKYGNWQHQITRSLTLFLFVNKRLDLLDRLIFLSLVCFR